MVSEDGTVNVYLASDTSVTSGPVVFTLSCAPEPLCYEPTDLVVSSVTTIGASVSWSSDNEGDTFEYQVVEGGTSPAETGTASTETSVDLSGLSEATTYDFYVRSSCTDGTFSEWASVSFSTPNGADCGETITYTQVANGDYTVMLVGGEPAAVTVNANMETNYDFLYVYDGAGNLLNSDQTTGIFTDVTYTSTDGIISV